MLLRRCLAALAFVLTTTPIAASAEPPPLAMVPQLVLEGGAHDRIALSPDGRLAASVHRDLVHLWDTETGALLRILSPPGTGLYGAPLLFQPGESALFAARYDLTVTSFDLETGLARNVSRGRAFGFSAGVFSADGRYLFAGEMAGRLLRWDARAGKIDHVFDGSDPTKAQDYQLSALPPSYVAAVALSARGDVGLVARSLGPVEVWDTEKGVKRFFLGKTSNAGAPMALSPDGARALVRTDAKNAFELWDAAKGSLVRAYAGPPAESLVFLPDGRRALVAARGEMSLVDLEDGHSMWSVPVARAASIALSADGRRVLVGSAGQLELRDAEDGALRRSFTADKPPVSPPLSFTFSESGDRVVSTSKAASGLQNTVWDLGRLGRASSTREPLPTNAGPSYVKPIATSADGRLGAFVVNSVDSKQKPGALYRQDIRITDLETGRTKVELAVDAAYIKPVAFSPDGARLACGIMCRAKKCGGGHFLIFDVKTGALQKDVEQTGATVDALAFSPDNKKLAVGGGARTLDLVDVETGKTENHLGGHLWWVDALAFSPDGRFLLSTGPDGITRMNRTDGGAAVTLVTAGDEWLVYGDDGLFDASRRGGALAAAVQGLSAYRIDQLAALNNRPDLLLERMGLGSPEILAHFRARHARRMQKLGLAEARPASLGKAPEARIASATAEGEWATLDLELEASALARYNVFVNDVPLFGPLGKTIEGKKARLTEKIALSAGKNKIEVSALDASGVESLRAYRVLDGKGSAKRDLYYVAFGVSRYKNPKFNLGFPHKDVLDLGEVFRAGEGVFERVHVFTFVNEEATVANVRRAKELVRGARPGDVVVLFIAGHGLHAPDAAADYYFATHEIEPKRLAETAAPFELFEDLLATTPARQKLFLMDTCESGERDDDAPASAPTSGGARALRPRSARALELEAAVEVDKNKETRPAARPFLSDRDRYIYNDLSRRTGAIVLSSSRGSEVSYELEELQNGVFTESMLIALTTGAADRDGDSVVSTDELRAYLVADVAARTGDKQHPTVDRDNLEARFGLPVTKKASAIVGRPDPASQGKPLADPGAPRALRPSQARGCGCEVAGAPASPGGARLWALFAILTIFRRAIDGRARRR